MSGRGPYGSNIKLPSLELLFSTEEQRQETKLEKVQQLPIDQLFPFPDHPFQVRDDAEMQKMVESVKEYGVLTPLIARPRPEGGYEIVAGHRRKRACELAGIETLPVLVREMDDDTAVIRMVDTNCQRENVSAIEKAKAYKMKLEAMKRQAGRPSKENSATMLHHFEGKKSRQIIADEAGISHEQVRKYIRLNELIPELQELVEENRLKFNPAVELSYLAPQEQQQFYEYIQSEECTPSLSQAQQLKAASKDDSFSGDRLKEIMAARTPSVKPREPQVSIPLSKIERFFPDSFSTEQIVVQIIRMLEARQRGRQRSHGEDRER